MLYRFKFKSFGRIAISLVVVLMVIVVGSVGFMVLEDYTFVEAFYMTMITVSTVGFREVHELSPDGMIFTSLLIIFSIGTFAYTISAVTSLGAAAPGISTPPITRSASSTCRSRASRVEKTVLVDRPNCCQWASMTSGLRSMTQTSAPMPTAI